MSETVQHFNIMDRIPNAHEESDLVLASYDMVNRMVALIGDIKFEDLFQMPLSRLADEHLHPKCEYAAGVQFPNRPFLIKSLERVTPHLETLKNHHISFSEYLSQSSDVQDDRLLNALMGLRRAGLHIPAPAACTACPPGSGSSLQSLTNLLEYAGDVTYRDLYTKAQAELPPYRASAIIKSIRGALNTGLIYTLVHYYCCKTDVSKCVETLCVSTCIPGGSDCGLMPCPCGRPPRRP